MADAADKSGPRVAISHPVHRGSRARRVQSVLRALPRVVLLFVIVYALTGPIDRMPLMAGAAGLSPAASDVQAAPVFQETGFAVADGPIGTYFAARGGVRTFGPPVSNEFLLLGLRTQVFRDHVLKVEPGGTVSTVNLFALGAIPFRNVGGRIIPEADQALVAGAPVPGSADYGTRVQAFIKENVPDQWEGLPVGFYQAFLRTVTAEDALPNGGEMALLPGFSHEVWGLPVSRPTRDAQDPNVVLLRWERGVMAWSRQTGAVTTVPLGETFKQVLTGEGLGPERTAAAAGSPFLLQLQTTAPGGVARPGELPDTILASAFTQGGSAINAAQLSDPDAGEASSGVSAGFNPASYVAVGQNTYDCEDFQSQAEAQAVLRFDPSDPNKLDLTNKPATSGPDGIACNSAAEAPVWGRTNPFPKPPVDMTPVARAASNSPPAPAAAAPPAPPAAPGAVGAVPPPPATGAGAALPASSPVAGDLCYHDEQITFSPSEPRVNNEMLIAVTSSRPHPYGRLAGTERTTFVRERPGQLGYVWEWTVALSYPGKHTYTFYVDSTVPCKEIEITIRQALTTRTPTPTKTATPWGWDNGNSNGNGNGNGNDNSIYVTTSPPWNPFVYIGQGDLYNCESFQSQAQAQSVLRADPTDPNNLDLDFDGVACEEYGGFSYPNEDDTSRVARQVAVPTATPTPLPVFPNDYVTQGDRYNCIDFASQAQAQQVLRYGFQVGAGDPNRLDTHNLAGQPIPDGIACRTGDEAPEWRSWMYWPEPHDFNPVPR